MIAIVTKVAAAVGIDCSLNLAQKGEAGVTCTRSLWSPLELVGCRGWTEG